MQAGSSSLNPFLTRASESTFVTWINRHGTGTADPVISAPTHWHDVACADDIKMLPLSSCVMSHFERKLFSEHFNLNIWRMLVYLCVGGDLCLRPFCISKIDRRDGQFHIGVPKKVRCTIFNGIPPIWD